MRFKLNKRLGAYGRWLKWFAWYPVKCDMDIGRPTLVWLENIERYKSRPTSFGSSATEYRTLLRHKYD